VRLDTARLSVRDLAPADAPFILALLNEPSFIQNIADRGVRTLEDARRYVEDGPMASYARHGFGLYLVELSEPRTPIGICGVLRRDALPDPDLGFAFLPAYWKQGYAFESAAAVRHYARTALGIGRLLAIVNPGNAPSIRLLERLGFRFERMARVNEGRPDVKVFVDEGAAHA
jgi:[ribosomal protein S5]-alanine N-acetyltransferase